MNIFSTTVHIYEHWTNRHPQFIRQFSHSSRLPTLTPPVPKQQTKTDRKQNSGQQTKLNNLPTLSTNAYEKIHFLSDPIGNRLRIVRVTPVTGEPVVFMFSANPEITYTATGATISTTSQDPVTFDFEAIEFIDFVKYGSVNEIAGTPVSMRVTNDAIVIENAGEGSMLSIYTLDGRCVVNTTIPDSYSVERSLLAKGAYIIKINKTTFKILL